MLSVNSLPWGWCTQTTCTSSCLYRCILKQVIHSIKVEILCGKKFLWYNDSLQINYQASKLRGYLIESLTTQVSSNHMAYWSNLKYTLLSQGKRWDRLTHWMLTIGWPWVKGTQRWKVRGKTHTCSTWDTDKYRWSTSAVCQRAKWRAIGVSWEETLEPGWVSPIGANLRPHRLNIAWFMYLEATMALMQFATQHPLKKKSCP